ncbi:class I SAM-dependent methyltransferase [Haloechinothrix halophila]|uniref:class I SAM-dependent methyltransferase n=1 Tax=Haloechinothrix halophila TaxID=1069073 RepID=UPI000687839E|nr:methyltransferase domain-containing protein [Haloechinothrix halophila]
MTHEIREEPTVATAAKPRHGHGWEGVSVAAERYERDLVPALFEPWAGVLVDIAGLAPGDRVLDLACGTGMVARAAAGRVSPGGYVCGLDVNEDMLAVARRVDVDIEWRKADARCTGLPDASFDAALCQQGLQFVPDRLSVLREIRRVLVPGGRAVLATWCATNDGDAGYAPIAAAFRRHRPDDSDLLGFIGAIFGLSDGTEVGRLAEAAGFDDVSVERRAGLVRFPSAEAWVEAFLGAAPVPSVATLEPATRAAIVADAASALRPYIDRAGLAFPLHTNIVLCRRGPLA